MRRLEPTRAFTAILLLLLVSAASGTGTGAPVLSVEGPASLSGEVDWPARLVRFTAVIDGRTAGLRLPSARIEAERAIEAALPTLAKDLLFSIPVDARRTILDTIADGTIDVDSVLGALEARRRVSGSFSPDLSTFSVEFELPLSALETLYVRHTLPSDRPPSLEWAPTGSYTGIVIYAALPLPVRGEHVETTLRPCLFPRVWDGDMVSVLESNMVDPAAIARWGVAGYAVDVDSVGLEERVGDAPLRASARMVFGNGRTDLVISTEDARRIFGSPENSALIKEGRVIIVAPGL
ncbi:MAG: hypothetical protein JXA15_07910 [Spirochaetales bacterium]|nr:hypothetical protein [Spirochaetales bacterium]